MNTPKITLIGGPTAIIEIAEFRFLPDPTFDEPGEYKLPHVTLTKTSRPALSLNSVPSPGFYSATITISTTSTIPAAHFSSRRRACSRLQSPPNVSAAASKVCGPGNQ